MLWMKKKTQLKRHLRGGRNPQSKSTQWIPYQRIMSSNVCLQRSSCPARARSLALPSLGAQAQGKSIVATQTDHKRRQAERG
jgi:hypothetical protein